MGETMPRSLRIPPDVWDAAVAKAKAEGTTVTAVVLDALREFIGEPQT
jgi:predicted HicB family RNase H-like nuclease